MTIEGLFTNVATLLQTVAPAAAIVVALAAGIYFAHGSLTDNPGSHPEGEGGRDRRRRAVRPLAGGEPDPAHRRARARLRRGR